MIRLAAEHGTTALVATPHADHEYRYEPVLIAERLAQLSEAAGGVIELYSGCDFHLNYENIQDALENPRKYTINRKNYLLVEFSNLQIIPNTGEIFAQLARAGMVPVITHPERNPLLRRRIKDIEAWVNQGATAQITAQSLTGHFGRNAQDFCKRLLEGKLVHFVASDAHDCQHRPPRLDLARKWLAENCGEQAARTLCVDNPRAAVEGEPLEPLVLDHSPAVRKWYQLWH